jgi:hypothetical protein
MELTPWYLRLLGFKKYRRWEVVRVLILYDCTKWVYDSDKDLEWRKK